MTNPNRDFRNNEAHMAIFMLHMVACKPMHKQITHLESFGC